MDPSLQSMIDGLLANEALNKLVSGPDEKFQEFLDDMFQPGKFFPLEDAQKRSSGILLAVLKTLAQESGQEKKMTIVDDIVQKTRPQMAVAAGRKHAKRTTKKPSSSIRKTRKRTKNLSK
jgi:hypothetical protein